MLQVSLEGFLFCMEAIFITSAQPQERTGRGAPLEEGAQLGRLGLPVPAAEACAAEHGGVQQRYMTCAQVTWYMISI